MELYFEIAGNQIDGARDYQEDAFLTTYLDDVGVGGANSSALVVMADGMGGHAAGDIASNLVVSTFNKMFTGEFGKQDVASILRVSLEKANGALRESIKETPALDGMGCTMVTTALTQSKAWWVSVGDSHFYLIRDRELIKNNEDHSYGGYLDRMKAQGMDIEPEPGLSRNMLMSAMTGDEVAEIDCPEQPLELQAGDRLVIASDGLDTLSDGAMLQFSAWASSAKECVDGLLKAVEDAGKPRQDNTTVIVVDVLERGAAPAVAPPPPAPEPEPRDERDITQPVDQVDIPSLDAPVPDVAAQADVTTTIIEDEPSSGKGKGALIAIIIIVLLAVVAGGGVWFFMSGSSENEQPMFTDPPEGADSEGEPEPVEPEPEPIEPDLEPQPIEPEPEPVTVAAGEFRDQLKDGTDGPLMVRIPGGKFGMGALDFTANQDEIPQHEVVVLPLAVGKFEVTYAEYGNFVESTGRRPPRSPEEVDPEIYPVTYVTWEDALAYTKWLTVQTGEKYRLLSEAEWEYVARANTVTLFWWGNEAGRNNAHCADCKSKPDKRFPTSVGDFPVNQFGVHDIAGNVEEWVHDCYKANYVGAPSDGSVWEHGGCDHRVIRGGAHDSPASSLRSSSRNKRRPSTGYGSVGIRLARDLNL